MNQYDELRCRDLVEQNYIQHILKKFGTSTLLFYDKSLAKRLQSKEDLENIYKSAGAVPTPRCMQSMKLYSCALYYYIDYILHTKPKNIADVGCGENFFKDIIDGICGFEPEGTYADYKESFDLEGSYTSRHLNEFDAAISVNSIHFISLYDFANQVLSFSKIIKQGGRGFLSMNAARMVEKTNEEDLLSLFSTTCPTATQIQEYIIREVEKINLTFVVIDILVDEVYDEWLDGNIRLVFEA